MKRRTFLGLTLGALGVAVGSVSPRFQPRSVTSGLSLITAATDDIKLLVTTDETPDRMMSMAFPVAVPAEQAHIWLSPSDLRMIATPGQFFRLSPSTGALEVKLSDTEEWRLVATA